MGEAQELSEAIARRYLDLVHYQRHRRDAIQKEFGISGRQLAVLRHLVQSGPHFVGQISRSQQVSDATTSPMLERMERAGYVTRHRSPEDSRKVLAEATDFGREVASQAPLTTIEIMRVHLPELPLEELVAIDEALKKILDIVVKWDDIQTEETE